jgi:hypothetical protein
MSAPLYVYMMVSILAVLWSIDPLSRTFETFACHALVVPSFLEGEGTPVNQPSQNGNQLE